MTHEPECPFTRGAALPLKPELCSWCATARAAYQRGYAKGHDTICGPSESAVAAYQRGREDAAKAVAAMDNHPCYECDNYALAIAAARGDGEQDA